MSPGGGGGTFLQHKESFSWVPGAKWLGSCDFTSVGVVPQQTVLRMCYVSEQGQRLPFRGLWVPPAFFDVPHPGQPTLRAEGPVAGSPRRPALAGSASRRAVALGSPPTDALPSQTHTRVAVALWVKPSPKGILEVGLGPISTPWGIASSPRQRICFAPPPTKEVERWFADRCSVFFFLSHSLVHFFLEYFSHFQYNPFSNHHWHLSYGLKSSLSATSQSIPSTFVFRPRHPFKKAHPVICPEMLCEPGFISFQKDPLQSFFGALGTL